MILALVPVALAAPVGEPIPSPEAGRVGLRLRVDYGVSGVVDRDCDVAPNIEVEGACGDLGADGTGCEATVDATTTALELDVALFEGLGVYVSAGRVSNGLDAADYGGVGSVFLGGMRGAVRLTRAAHIAGDLRVSDVGTRACGSGNRAFLFGCSDDLADQSERLQAQQATATLLGVLGHPADDLTFYLGGQAGLGSMFLWPLGAEDGTPIFEMALDPQQPLTGVAGLGFTSPKLGSPWRSTTRLTLGFEARFGQESGGSLWAGTRF